MLDPALSAWRKPDERLKKKGLPKWNRSCEPNRNPNYPTKVKLGLDLLHQFQETHDKITVKAILADALYGESRFLDPAWPLGDEVQVISQLPKNQNIWYRGRKQTLEDYFNSINRGVIQTFWGRGQPEIQGWMSSARLQVDAQGNKRFVITVKYPTSAGYLRRQP